MPERASDPSSRHLYVVLKVAEVCNIACTYCYFFFSGDESHLQRPRLMHSQVAREIADFLADGVDEHSITHITLCFHGGEPLMLGVRRFRDICSIFANRLSRKVHLRFDVQTNGMLLSDDWIKALSELEVGVGVSLDGPKDSNDRFRIDKVGGGTFERSVHGLKLLQSAARNGQLREPTVICVVGEDSQPDETFELFVDKLRVKAISFRPPIADWRAREASKVARAEVFFRRILQLWLERNDPDLVIGPFRGLMGSLLAGGRSRHPPREDYMPLIVIHSDGTLGPHDALNGMDARFQTTGFSAQQHSLSDFMRADIWTDILVGLKPSQRDCIDCKWVGVCKSGEIEDRYVEGAGFTHKSMYCSMYLGLCEDLLRYASRAVPIAELEDGMRQLRRTALSAGYSPDKEDIDVHL